MNNRSNINLVGNGIVGQNMGSGTGVYKGKSSGTVLQYKSLNVTGSTMTITSDDNNIYFSANTGGGGGSGENITKEITQTSHGFAVQDFVGWSGGNYTKAIADGSYDGEFMGLVTDVVDANTFCLTQAGYVSELSGLVANTTYFLSKTTAGQITTTQPTNDGDISKAVIVTDSTTSGWVLPYAGYVFNTGDTTGGGGADPAGSDTQIQYNDNGSFGASPNLIFNGSALRITGNTNITGVITTTSTNNSPIRIENGTYINAKDTGGTGTRILGMDSLSNNVLLGSVENTTASICMFLGGGYKHEFCSDGTIDIGGDTNINGVLGITGDTTMGGNLNYLGGVLSVCSDGEISARFLDNSCVELRYNGAEKFKTVTNGVCATGCGFATDWIATSDQRLKDNIVPISSALSKVDSLCGVCYDFREDGSPDMGLIAQDVINIEPRLVSKSVPSDKQRQEYGIDDDLLGLKYEKFAGLFVEAIKELKQQNACLQNQINEIRKKI